MEIAIYMQWIYAEAWKKSGIETHGIFWEKVFQIKGTTSAKVLRQVKEYWRIWETARGCCGESQKCSKRWGEGNAVEEVRCYRASKTILKASALLGGRWKTTGNWAKESHKMCRCVMRTNWWNVGWKQWDELGGSCHNLVKRRWWLDQGGAGQCWIVDIVEHRAEKISEWI